MNAPEAEPENPETAATETVLLDSVPVEEDANLPDRLLEMCPACGTMMDVTDQAPFAHVHCPSCGQGLRTRKQFRNYTILDQLGEGGMGAVFKAVDATLNRQVALKVLKKSVSANVEEREKLEQEARITASINHPHIVKVFSFGEDHGEFYLAMELVEKGSLDELMNLQGNVAEAQILEVGIQIAQGLEAAFEKGLIHRDIKPGNILFAEARTAKLVDFGLAIVMDEAAQARGEIWGTPYYIAPEKLDNQPEDFRSDIYSLGGTLFHALAGRPPYEANTASMVALKQLKSQPVSLQAFAPEVSSETAYVINRMLAKNPDDRYASYAELIQHLSYARNKLLERLNQPRQAQKPRVVMETSGNRVFSALLSLGLLVGVVIALVVFFLLRPKPETPKAAAPPAAGPVSPDQVEPRFYGAVQAIAARRYTSGLEEFSKLAEVPGVKQPMKNWILMNEALAASLAGNLWKSASIFAAMRDAGPYTTQEPENVLAGFFVEAGKLLAKPEVPVSPAVQALYSPTDFEAFGLFCFGVRNWTLGKFPEAEGFFQAFSRARVPSEVKWMELYQPLARSYASDSAKVSTLEKEAASAGDPAAKAALLQKVREAKDSLEIGGAAKARLEALEKQLQSSAAP